MTKGNDSDSWAIVLAGGEGTRLSTMTSSGGRNVPKQFCAFDGKTTMVRWAIERAARLVPRERIMVVVSEHHRPFWSREIPERDRDNVVVQPRNLGTAAGILLPALRVLARSPRATLLVLPSDHFVEREDVLTAHLARAAAAARRSRRIVLLGLTPDASDRELGFILPSSAHGDDGTQRVAGFFEKPDPATAARLRQEGALWSSFTLAASLVPLLLLYRNAVPWLLTALLEALRREAHGDAGALADLYGRMDACDFSKAVLEPSADALAVVPVPACGWLDMGTPARVQRYLEARDVQQIRRELPQRLVTAHA